MTDQELEIVKQFDLYTAALMIKMLRHLKDDARELASIQREVSLVNKHLERAVSLKP